jgi:hypothetical protein
MPYSCTIARIRRYTLDAVLLDSTFSTWTGRDSIKTSACDEQGKGNKRLYGEIEIELIY